MTARIVPGFAFWEADGRGDREHLYFVLTCMQEDNQVAVVNVSSLKNRPSDDRSCMISDSEHPELWKLSFVYYRGMRILDARRLSKALDRGDLYPVERLSPNLIHRALRGASLSPHCSPNQVAFLAARTPGPSLECP